MNIEQALSHAKFYIYQDQKELAREILVAILREDPNNAEAWVLSAQVSDKLEQVHYCLRRASELNPKALETHPNAPQIHALIDRLQQPLTPVPPTHPLQSVLKTDMEVEKNEPVEPPESSLPEVVNEGMSTNSEPPEETTLEIIEQKVPGGDMENIPAPAESASSPAQPEPAFVGPTGKPATKVPRKRVWWPWVVGLIVVAILVTVGIIFGIKLVNEFLPQLLSQYFQ